MKFIYFIVLIGFLIQLTYSASKKKEIKVDNRVICMKGKKGAKLNEIQYVGIVRTTVDLMTFFKQFRPPHVVPKENKKTYVSPKFITGTLSAIAKRECRQFDKEGKLEKDELFGIIFPNGKQHLSLFHDSDFKWSGSGSQLKWQWEDLKNYQDIV